MRRFAAALSLAALVASPALAQPRGPSHGGPGTSIGNLNVPSEIVAADSALARLAREKDLASALRTTAAPDAQLLLANQPPLRVAAWLKSKPTLPAAPAWQTNDVWMSCDGSYAVSHGAGYITVWQRQKKGGYQWVLQGWDAAYATGASEDWINGKVADCPPRRKRPISEPAEGSKRPQPDQPRDRNAPPPEYTIGHAADGTLTWDAGNWPRPSALRGFALKLKQDGEMREVLPAHP